MTTITKLADRALGRVLSTSRAGACVPEHGDPCGCKYYGSRCTNGKVWIIYRSARIDCYGACRNNSTSPICRRVNSGSNC